MSDQKPWMEMIMEVYDNDGHTSFGVGHDPDGLGMVEVALRYEGKAQSTMLMSPAAARLIAKALVKVARDVKRVEKEQG